MEKYLLKRPLNVNEDEVEPSNAKRVQVEFNANDIIADLGLHKSIEDYDIAIRDQVRREYLLKGPCQPFGHNFPKKQHGKTKRNFKESWFRDFEWLEYSVSKDEAYCLWCYLFRPIRRTKHGDVFTKTGFSNWQKAVQMFNDHVGNVNSYHNDARRQCEAFKNQRQSISHLLSAQSQKNGIDYRTRLTAILDVIRLLLKQGLAFRGHDESSKSNNRGNFLEFLEWYSLRNVEVGKTLKFNAPGNNQMTSPKTQKELVNACALETTLTIINDIGDRFFSLLVDESRDKSLKEQMIVVLWYVNKHGEAIERFLGVEHVSDTCSQSLKVAIEKLFCRYGLSLSRLRGQGYDGASNMRGEFNGLKSLIWRDNPSAIYVHCFAHQLQLVVVSLAKNNIIVGDFFNHTSMIVNMVSASCKRKDALRQSQHEKIVEQLEKEEIFSGRGKNQETSLARPGDTCWGSYYITIIRLNLMWSSVLEVLENVCEDGVHTEQRSTAMSLISKMESFEFVFTMHLMMKIMSITNELSQALQRKDQDIVNAMNLVKIVKHRLQSLRELEWGTILEDVRSFCMKNSITIPDMNDNMSVRGRSRRGGQIVTYFHHFRVELFCQVIDLVSQEMNTRFTEANSELLLCISCLNPRNSFSAFDDSKLLRLAEFYPEDFKEGDHLMLKEQLCTYIDDVRNNDVFSDLQDIGKLSKKMVETGKHKLFPLVYLLIELALVLPVATASVERAFSAMNIIKNDLRNKMGDEWMNDSLIVYIEREIFDTIENESILQRFQNMQTRRIQLPSLTRIASGTSNVTR